jgi:hypothetical protein
MSKQKPSHEVEGIVRRAPRQEAQIWGRVSTNFCIIEGPQEQRPPSFLNGRGLEPPRLFLELSWLPSQTEQSGEKGLGQGGDQEPDGHSVRVPLWRWENRPGGQTSLQQSTKSGFFLF